MISEIDQFIEDYAQELISGNAAYFIGAGVSVDSKLPNWEQLIKPFTSKIGITDIKNKDMPLMAQYIVNEDAGNRGPFINAIAKRLRRSFSPNPNHEAIAQTNLKTIWTTNYDNLLEKVFANTIVDVKATDESISRDVPETQVEIIKMHGCIFHSHINDIVITKADYEDFFVCKPATAQRLRLDLLQKSFLFIGYGYGDPNIQNIITEARRLARSNTRQHYLITKAKPGCREFILWSNNLRRYGIRVISINDFPDLTPILLKLSLMSRGKSVFITGSHDTKDDLDAKQLSGALAKEPDIVLNDGQSAGLMRVASTEFMQTIIEGKADINKRLHFFPNPYAANSQFANNPSLIPILKQWRIPLFKATHIVVAFDGGMGTKAEIEVALDMGCIVIPFFKDRSRDTWYLLENKQMLERLSKYDTKYVGKLKEESIKYESVLQLIRNIFNSKANE